jgi:hypothetical protein
MIDTKECKMNVHRFDFLNNEIRSLNDQRNILAQKVEMYVEERKNIIAENLFEQYGIREDMDLAIVDACLPWMESNLSRSNYASIIRNPEYGFLIGRFEIPTHSEVLGGNYHFTISAYKRRNKEVVLHINRIPYDIVILMRQGFLAEMEEASNEVR